MSIIAIHGADNVGKSTIAKELQWLLQNKNVIDNKEIFESNVKYLPFFKPTHEVKSFATKVNDSYKLITGIDFHSLDRNNKERERESFSNYAQAMKNLFGEKIWCNALFKDVNPITDGINWIIDDLRYKVEYDYLKSLGAKFIRVDKTCPECYDSITHDSLCSTGKKYINDSELNSYKMDAYIQNDFSEEILTNNVKTILQEWKILK